MVFAQEACLVPGDQEMEVPPGIEPGMDILQTVQLALTNSLVLPSAPFPRSGASVQARTTTYSANDVDGGTGWLSSIRPSM